MRNKYHWDFLGFDYSTEESTNSALKHVAIFYIYLIALTFVSHFITANPNFYFNNRVKLLFKQSYYIPKYKTISFEEVLTIPDIWNYMNYVVLRIFHGVTYDTENEWEPYMNENKPNLYGRIFLNSSLLLGPPRLRQIRVRPDTCSLNSAFVRYYGTCMAPYSSSAESRDKFYKGTPYKTLEDLNSATVSGKVHSYSSGGYVQDLTYRAEENRAIVRHLQNITWLDRGSRLFLMEFNMLNLNMAMYYCVKLIFEIMPSGLVIPSYHAELLYTDIMYLLAQPALIASLLCILIINSYFTYVEAMKIYIYGFYRYITNFTIILTLPRVIIIYGSFCFAVYHYFVSRLIDINIDEAQDFTDLEKLCKIVHFHRVALGILVFVSWMDLMRFMDYNSVVKTFGTAFHMASTDLITFMIMFVVMFTAWANLGVLLFGNQNADFKDFPTGFITMVRIMVSDFDYFQLEAQFAVLAPVFFVTYITLTYYVLLNMFLAVIVSFYRTATKTMVKKPNFLMYVIRKKLFRLTNGRLPLPDYPKLDEETTSSHSLNARKLEELKTFIGYTETEIDLNVLLRRLDIIETILYRLTNDIDNIIATAKKQKRKSSKS